MDSARRGFQPRVRDWIMKHGKLGNSSRRNKKKTHKARCGQAPLYPSFASINCKKLLSLSISNFCFILYRPRSFTKSFLSP